MSEKSLLCPHFWMIIWVQNESLKRLSPYLFADNYSLLYDILADEKSFIFFQVNLMFIFLKNFRIFLFIFRISHIHKNMLDVYYIYYSYLVLGGSF